MGSWFRAVTPSLAASVLLLFVSCGGEGPVEPPPPPVPSAATSTLSISSPTVTSGSAVTVTLQARTADGTAMTAGGASVAFSLTGSGTSSGTVGPTSDNGNGTYSASITGTTAGTARQVSAAIEGTAVTTALPSLTVAPGPFAPAQSTVAVSSATVASGSTATFTLTARDAASNLLAGGNGTVVFTLGAGTSGGTLSPVNDHGDGTYTATFSATTAGSPRAVSATYNGTPVTSALPSIATVPGPASSSQSIVEVGAATIVAGSSTALTLRVRDAAGNAHTAGGLVVAFTKGGGTSDGTIGTVTDHANGTYTATFTGTTAGSARTIGATIGGSAVTSTLPAITVQPAIGTISPTTSTVAVSVATITSGSTSTVTLTARDASDNPITSGGATVAFSLSGSGTSTGTFSAVTDHGNGTYTATLTGVLAGTAREVAATINSSAVTTTKPTFTVVAGAISVATSTLTVSSASIASGTDATITLQAKDANGNNLTAGGSTVAFAKGSGTSDGTLSTVTDNANGTYSATFSGTIAGTARTISATIGGSAVTTTEPTITVVPGAISPVTSLVTVGSATVTSGATTTVTLQAKDAAGNNLTAGGATVAFTLGTGTSAGTLSAVTDNGNGTYVSTFTATTAGTARTIEATIGGTAVSSTLPAVTVTAGAISTAKSLVTASAPSVAVGSSVTLTLTARDANENLITTGGATVAFTVSGGTSAGTVGTVTDNANGTYTATYTGTTAGTGVTVYATIGGNSVVSTAPLIVYTPGMTLTTSNLLINVTQGQASTAQLIGVFANGGTTVEGLQTNISYTAATGCPSGWLGTPSFDFTTANPFSILTLTANAAALAVTTCTATVTISSTTSGIASKVLNVTAAVARSTVAVTAVNMVLMGDAGNTAVQDLTPDARVTITNGGRGSVTGLRAVVDSAIEDGDITGWLKTTDLSWEPVVADTMNRPAPATLKIKTSVAPFSASAVIRVTGNGISPIRIPLNVLFNIQAELVTNPRGLALNAFAGGANVETSVLAFNQNREVADQFVAFERDASRALPSWLTLVSSVNHGRGDGTDSAATFTFRANPTGLQTDSIYADTVRLRAFNADSSSIKTFNLPVAFVIERGLVIAEGEVTMFGAAGSTTVTKDIAVTNGGATAISGLSASVGGAGWLTATFVGGTDAPSTLRLTANPAGLPKGTEVTTMVTVSASSPSGVPPKSFQVTFRVY